MENETTRGVLLSDIFEDQIELNPAQRAANLNSANQGTDDSLHIDPQTFNEFNEIVFRGSFISELFEDLVLSSEENQTQQLLGDSEMMKQINEELEKLGKDGLVQKLRRFIPVSETNTSREICLFFQIKYRRTAPLVPLTFVLPEHTHEIGTYFVTQTHHLATEAFSSIGIGGSHAYIHLLDITKTLSCMLIALSEELTPHEFLLETSTYKTLRGTKSPHEILEKMEEDSDTGKDFKEEVSSLFNHALDEVFPALPKESRHIILNQCVENEFISLQVKAKQSAQKMLDNLKKVQEQYSAEPLYVTSKHVSNNPYEYYRAYGLL